MSSKTYRVEALNHDKKFTLLGFEQELNKAAILAHLNDDFFVRIFECGKPRKEVHRNYTEAEWRGQSEFVERGY